MRQPVKHTASRSGKRVGPRRRALPSPGYPRSRAARGVRFLLLPLLLLITAAGCVFLAVYLNRQTDFLAVREILAAESDEPAESDETAESVETAETVDGTAATLEGAPDLRAVIALALPNGSEFSFPLQAGSTCDRDCRIKLAPGVRAIFSILDRGRLYVESPARSAGARIRIFAYKKDWWKLDEGRAWLIGSEDSVGDDRDLTRLRFDLESDRAAIRAGGMLSLRLRAHSPEHIARIGGALGDALLLFESAGADSADSADNVDNADSVDRVVSADQENTEALGYPEIPKALLKSEVLKFPSDRAAQRGMPFSIAYAGVDCALTNADQRLAIWSFGHTGSWYMRSWRVPLESFKEDTMGRGFLARSAYPYPRSVYPPVPRDWQRRWIAKRDAIMEAGKTNTDWQRLQAVYTNAAPLGGEFSSDERALRAPLRIPIARYDMISSPYGVVRYLTSADGSWHRGIDFAAPPIAEARTPWPGQVVFADMTLTGGNMVIVRHGFGVYSSFMHLSAFRAKPGACLRAGETVGLVGTTGLSTGPHLHYELRVGNRAIDPTPYFIRSPFAREPEWKALEP